MVHAMKSLTRVRPLLLLLAVALVAGMAAPVSAQDGNRGDRRGARGDRGGRGGGGWGGWGQMMRPEFVRRDLVLISTELELDKSQNSIAEALLLDYETAYGDASQSMREQFAEIRPGAGRDPAERAERDALREQFREIRRELRDLREQTPEGEEIDPKIMEQFEKRMEPLRVQMELMRPQMPQGADLDRFREGLATIGRDWATTRSQLREEFLGNLKVVLNDEQVELWPGFERALRREKSLGYGRLSGESVNLFTLLRQMGLGDDQMHRLAPVLDDFAVRLDEALVARDTRLAESRQEMMQAMFSRDIDRSLELTTEENARRVAVRNANEYGVESIAAALPGVSEDPGAPEAFRESYLTRAYTRIYRPTRMQRAFDAAEKLENLDPEILSTIAALETAYTRELGGVNARLMQLTREQEPKEAEERLRRRAARFSGETYERPESPLRAMFETRQELDTNYRAQLEAMLTPEQVAELPAAEPDRRARGMGGGRGGFPGGRGGNWGANREERRAQMLKKFDTDGDGELSNEERRNARDTMRQRYRELGGPEGRRGGRGGDPGDGNGPPPGPNEPL